MPKSKKPKIPVGVILHYMLIGFMSGALTGAMLLAVAGYVYFALFSVSSLVCWFANEWLNTSILEDWGIMEKKKPKAKKEKCDG